MQCVLIDELQANNYQLCRLSANSGKWPWWEFILSEKPAAGADVLHGISIADGKCDIICVMDLTCGGDLCYHLCSTDAAGSHPLISNII